LTPADHDHQPSRGLVEDVVADESAQVKAPREEAALDNGRFPYTAMTRGPAEIIASERMVKEQQMRWTPRGARLLLQGRSHVLNDQLAGDFCR
jgi:hypothetical protein